MYFRNIINRLNTIVLWHAVLLVQFLPNALFSQVFFDRNDSVEVSLDKEILNFPWTGGFNCCQFSVIDLNGDDIKDLFVFDKTGNRISTFVNTGKINEVSYRHAPEYISRFPNLSSWVLLSDYNNDGKEDVFSSTSGGIIVYKNISDATGLKFQLQKNLLMSDYGSLLNLYVSPSDLPAIIDVDDDGDTDILTFSILGNYVEWHKNLSRELYGHSDSLIYKLETSCWGKFEENNLSNAINLNVSCQERSALLGGERHSGSTLLALDYDGDLDKDIIIGDVSSKKLILLINGGDLKHALMVSQSFCFSSDTISAADISSFPAAFSLDLDNDDKNDIILSPNAPNVSENFESIYFYKNEGTSQLPAFVFQKNNFLQDNTLDFGEGAYPVIFDLDKDGKKDLFVGNYGYYNALGGNFISKIAYFKNNGTSLKPSYELISRDFASLSTSNRLNISPTFGDLDADGDADMIIGDQDGLIHYYECKSYSSNSFVEMPGKSYFNIDVGQAAAPFLFDVDADGKLDLIIGEKSGTLNYLPNHGTASNALYDTVIAFWGGVDVKSLGFTVGYSVPVAYLENGSIKLVVGSENGKLFLFDNVTNNLFGNFNLVTDFFGEIKEGIRSAPGQGDLNGDGLMDFVIGNYAGGLGFYAGNNKVSVFNGVELYSQFEVFPNPASQDLQVNFKDVNLVSAELIIYNLLGQVFLQQKISSKNNSVSLVNLPQGIYFVEISTDFGSMVKKIVKE